MFSYGPAHSLYWIGFSLLLNISDRNNIIMICQYANVNENRKYE